MDKALLTFAHDIIDVGQTRATYTTIATVPFNSRNKWMATIHALPKETAAGGDGRSSSSDGEDDLLLMKGAPEYMLQRCSTCLLPNGMEVELTSQRKQDYAQVSFFSALILIIR